MVFVHGRSEDGSKLAVVRKQGSRVSAGILSSLEHGAPIHGEVLRLSPREETPGLCDVEVVHATESAASRATDDVSSGPAQVATEAYRAGWDSIWGGRPSTKAELPN